MKLFYLPAAAALALCTGGLALASAPPASVMATVHGVVAAANADNTTRVGSYFVRNAVLVDEFAPYVWTGRDAAAHWWQAMDRMNASTHVTDMRIAVARVTQANIARSGAYVVVQMLITWRDHGKPWRESGLWALTLRNTGSSWKVASASWATSSVVSL